MYDYIKGELVETNPTEAVIENNGIGYKLQISLQTFADIQTLKETKLYIYHHVREDVELFYGFSSKEERSVFTMLIEVNGIGPNTARMMLSSLNRIGIKTAQRVIIDLKDKIGKAESSDSPAELFVQTTTSPVASEALSALVLLGFNKASADKVVKAILKEEPNCTLENLIKLSLKRL